MRKGRIFIGTCALVLLAAAAGGLARAQEKAEPKGVVAYRIAVMRTLGAQMMAIKTALTETPQFAGNVAWHARILHDALENLDAHTDALFPAGSTENSNALPAIWEKRAEFEAAARKAYELADAFLEVSGKSRDPKTLLPAFAKLGKQGCGGCHETFRRKPQG